MAEPFRQFTSSVIPLPAVNVDTDQIIPARFLKTTEKSGLADALFNDWRYLADGSPNPEFVLNKPGMQGRQILLTGDNFGAGSSREHVPQAMRASAIRCIVGRSFARIFYRNCLNLGLLAIVCPDLEPEGLDSEPVVVDTETGEVRVGERSYSVRPVPPFVLEMIEAGGLVPATRQRLG